MYQYGQTRLQHHHSRTHQPTPSRALNGSSLGVHLLFQVLHAAKVPFDQLDQLASLDQLALSGGSQVLPEQRVVNVSTSVELESGLKRNGLLDSLGGLGLGLELLQVFFGSVETGDICVVVLLVVEFHDLLANMRLEGLDGILMIDIQSVVSSRSTSDSDTKTKGLCGLTS